MITLICLPVGFLTFGIVDRYRIMSRNSREAGFENWRDKVVLGLIGLASLGALFGVTSSFPSVSNPELATTTGVANVINDLFIVSLFLLLGFRPRSYPGLWELVLLHRTALLGAGGIFLLAAPGISLVGLLADFGVLMILSAAYLFAGGYRVWLH